MISISATAQPSFLRVATIGCDPILLRLASAVARHNETHLIAGYDCSDALHASITSAMHALLADNSQRHDWEELLSGTMADLVVVGMLPFASEPSGVPNDSHFGRVQQREEMLRRLVQAEIPTVVVHPGCDMLLAYELQMIRADSRSILVPFVPWLGHSTIQRMVRWLKSNEPADVQQLLWERWVGTSEKRSQAVRAMVARDLFLLRRMIGEVTSVSATTGTLEAGPWSSLAVHLMSDEAAGIVGRWSLLPRGDASLESTVKWAGDQTTGRIELSVDQETIVEWTPSGDTPPQTESTENPFVAHLVAHIRDDQPWAGPTWEEACRSLEIVDAIDRSLQRRRTIELYHEQVTEHDTFKSVMAAGGCGMLLWVMILLLVAGIVEGLQLPIRETIVWRVWPIALVAPLAIFLALQLLQLVFKPKGKR